MKEEAITTDSENVYLYSLLVITLCRLTSQEFSLEELSKKRLQC